MFRSCCSSTTMFCGAMFFFLLLNVFLHWPLPISFFSQWKCCLYFREPLLFQSTLAVFVTQEAARVSDRWVGLGNIVWLVNCMVHWGVVVERPALRILSCWAYNWGSNGGVYGASVMPLGLRPMVWGDHLEEQWLASWSKKSWQSLCFREQLRSWVLSGFGEWSEFCRL